ncbi:MAG: hypothetical protein HOC23_04285 [Halieaceae bacterium]|nr:hypothetical protein [Halieaceae bacterium]
MKVEIYILIICVAAGTMKTAADDIDIYLDSTSNPGASYVHLTLDYQSGVFEGLCTYGDSCLPPFMSAQTYDNLGPHAASDTITRYDALVAIMTTIIDNPLFGNVYMSLLISNSVNGGTVLEGYKKLGDRGAELIATMRQIAAPKNSSEAHRLQPSETYYEWYRYINGEAVENGTTTENNFGETNFPGYDRSIITGGTYIPPFIDIKACTKFISILIAMNGADQDGSLSNQIAADMSGSASLSFENMMKYMHDSTSDLVSGIEGVQHLAKSVIISSSDGAAVTQGWVRAGGGESSLDIDKPAQVERALHLAFSEVRSTSSTYMPASVPLSAYNRAESLDNLFIALFEARSTQRWPGNIKKLKLKDTNADGMFDQIVDAVGDPGFESSGPNMGRIRFSAVTFWTDPSALPPGDGVAIPTMADGRVVARGGAGQNIVGFLDDGVHWIGSSNGGADSGFGSRQIYFEPDSITSGASNALVDFNSDHRTATALQNLLGASTVRGAQDLIQWGRGSDVDDEDGDGNKTEARSWIFSNVLHSRPLALNYGAVGGYSEGNPNIRLFLGTGDGMFHIIENTRIDGSESGREVLGFYPREMLANIATQRINTESSFKMRYGVDGSPVAFVVDVNNDGNLNKPDGDEAYVYFGLRRGGFSYYALDVSDPTLPPTLKWKISPTTGGDFDGMGLTFSVPVVGKVKYGGHARDVLIFGGGYNGGWDSNYTARVGKDAGDEDDVVGNALFIIDARTGELIWKAVNGSKVATDNTYYHKDLTDSIPSSVTALENGNGIVDRLYVGDTGGAIWRVDLPEGSTPEHRKNNWYISKFAELGTDGLTTDRRFFHPPDVVRTFDDNGNFDGVLISSGDRAHPNDLDVVNYLIYIKDRNTASGDHTVRFRAPLTISSAHLPDQTSCINGDEGSGNCATSLPYGWKVELKDEGEKGLSTPIVEAGRVFLSTFSPASGATDCIPTTGQGSVYLVNLADGTAVYNNRRRYDIGPGIPPGALVVGNALLLPGGGISVNDSDGDGDFKIEKLIPGLAGGLYRVYWREPGIDDL